MGGLTRRDFLQQTALITTGTLLSETLAAGDIPAGKPNVILCMTDDQGWGDTGYNGHPVLQTPTLDAMAGEGIRFDRFYSGAPVCSPTRGSCLTGRHPSRYGIPHANRGHMKSGEVTLAEALSAEGYRTGHFGKWHLGTLTTKIKDSNRGRPGDAAHYSPPWENGFEVCFSTEAKVPTFDPMKHPETGEPYGTHYWSGPDQVVTENLEGDDSRIIMDRALPFIRGAVMQGTPFLAVIWFHAPHLPVVAGRDCRRLYEGHPGADYLGCITAMDEQVGRLRRELSRLDAAGDTLLWFCSDNGPEGQRDTSANGSTKHLRGRKRSLYEGGLRVPGLLVWPDRIAAGRATDIPCCTSDYFPTLLDIVGNGLPEEMPGPCDGVSLLPLIEGRMRSRPAPIGFESGKQVSLIGNRYKIYSKDSGGTYELYDLIEDPGEKSDVAGRKPEILKSMRQTLEEWRRSCASDSPATADDHGPDRPNILFVMVDDLGKEWISCYGAEGIETPNIDVLSKGGMTFTNAYSMPQCTPSRATLLTGQYPWRTGWVNHWDVPRWGVGYFDWKFGENTTFARILKDTGYRTAAAGKWQINDFRIEPRAMEKHGFDDWCMWTGYETGNKPSGARYANPYINTPSGSMTHEGAFGPDVYADFLIEFMEKHREEPMALYFPMALTHTPLIPTPDEPDAGSKRERHMAMVRYTDKLVGRLVGALDRLHLREKTIVIFTTDNGSTQSIRGVLRGKEVKGGKATKWESGVCAPFIVNCPGLVPSGVVTRALTDFTDLLPTFCELAGTTVPDHLEIDGVSIAPLLLGKTDVSPREWIMALGHGPARLEGGRVRGRHDYASRVIRDHRFKVWVNEERRIERLSDLDVDPFETRNLIGSQKPEHRAAFEKFRAVVDAMPEKDAKPRYGPRKATPWDRQ
jgi:arylsulfatase A-like enzyme